MLQRFSCFDYAFGEFGLTGYAFPYKGTQAGDPTEANAVGEAFSCVRSAEDPLWLGAVKANIGHLEAASGMASLFKSILILEKGVIPPIACLEKMNTKIQAERYHLKVSKTQCHRLDSTRHQPSANVTWKGPP